MNVLVLAPHPDDEAIGCGGTMVKHALADDRVSVVFLTSGELGLSSVTPGEAHRRREAEATAAGEHLGVAECRFLRLPDWGLESRIEDAAGALAPILASMQPALIYLPHPGDDHPDHRACLPIIRAARRIVPGPHCELRGYEVWTPLPVWHLCNDIGLTMDRKLAAIAAYTSQLAQYRYDRAAVGLGQFRGALAGKCEFAEVFERTAG